MEKAIALDFNNNPNLIPYIQRHELEALLFSSRDGFELVLDNEDELAEIDSIIAQFSNPEDINNSPQTAPSKRLKSIFSYEKVNDGGLLIEMMKIEDMLKKCPRFKVWVDSIISKLST